MNNSKYQSVIGIEVHVELNTKTKMFCSCSSDYFGKKPNTHTCPICLGLPGALPYTNWQAIEKCLKIGLALNCQIAKESQFERKNYFYPDLPKGYQISQYRWPLSNGGWIMVATKDGTKSKIRINRVHQEEDTGKLTHWENRTLIDFNRSGVPLVEIVTEPDFRDTQEIKDYAKQLQLIFQTLGVSNADMEKGDMRLEANVSVRPVGQKELPNYRVELKNINSFRFMVSAVEFEIKRQISLKKKGQSIKLETRGWNEDKKETFLQRLKEEANDYRYFTEPDIPPLLIDRRYIENLKSQIPELPNQKEQKFLSWGVSKQTAQTIASSYLKSQVFEKSAAKLPTNQKASLANLFVNLPFGSKHKEKIDDQAQKLLALFKKSRINKSDSLTTSELKKVARQAILENKKIVSDYQKGNTNAIQALIGTVMKKTKSQANPQDLKTILEEIIAN